MDVFSVLQICTFSEKIAFIICLIVFSMKVLFAKCVKKATKLIKVLENAND